MADAAGSLAATGAGEAAVVSNRADHIFYSAMAIAILAAVFLGFARTYYLKEFFGTPPLSPIFHVHAIIFTTWLLLFVTQTTLVREGRTDVHRKLGYAGGALAAAMVVVGTLAALTSARLGRVGRGVGGLTDDPVAVFFSNMGDLVVFLTFLIPAFVYRRKPETHKRLMLLATTAGLMPAAIGRWPFLHHSFARVTPVILTFVLAGPIYDLISRRRVHSAYLWGLAIFVLTTPPFRIMLARIQAMHAFGAWLIH